MRRIPLAAAALAAVTLLLADQSPEEVRKALGDTEASDGWVYDDLPAGFAQARREGKPLFIVFR